jgi:putative transposase
MRRKRNLQSGAIYHVVARANRSEFILHSEEMKELMMFILKKAKKRYSFQVKNFCIMGNHIHLLIKPTKNESLSRIMQWILSVFAIRYNKLNGFRGHVWYDRFKSKIIASFRQFIHTFQYIQDNPIRAGVVGNPLDYKYGGSWHIHEQLYDLIDEPDLSILFGISSNKSEPTYPLLPVRYR